MILYIADVAHRFTTRLHKCVEPAAVTVVAGTATPNSVKSVATSATANAEPPIVTVTITAPTALRRDSGAVAGLFFYLHLPELSRLEWHPMSVALSDANAGSISFLIKAYDSHWTTRLHAMANTGKAAAGDAAVSVKLQAYVEGPYGYDWKCSAADRIASGGDVVFIAGGVGIAPFTSVLEHWLRVSPALLVGVHVIWSVRGAAVLEHCELLLRAAASAGAAVTVHCTRGSTAAGQGGDFLSFTTTDADSKDASNDHPPSASEVVSSSLPKSAASIFALPVPPAAAGQNLKFWNPGSVHWHWCVRA